MDFRCPHCSQSLRTRKLSQSVIARMEMDCPHCKGRIRLNIHRSEEAAVFFTLAALLILGALAYRYQSQGLAVAAMGAAFLGTALLPLIERFWLRAWPRYVAVVSKGVNRDS